MKAIGPDSKGAAVTDVQQRLAMLGLLEESQITGTFDEATQEAVKEFCRVFAVDGTSRKSAMRLAEAEEESSGIVDEMVWAALVDSTYHLGDRTLYLRMPYFHGNDVAELQKALGALGFVSGSEDGIFGVHTEDALRRFQLNLGLPSDGIAGAYTYAELKNLEFAWAGKEAPHISNKLGFARAADVLEQNALCLFGTDDFTRSIASRISNLAFATNPASKMISADQLSVAPDDNTLFVHISPTMVGDSTPTVVYNDDDDLVQRLSGALQMAAQNDPKRLRVVFTEKSWLEAGEERTAQHYAITLLDALCLAL